ncbi:homoserine dehydrogenase [Dermacoccaceae bacterium W4C1]
MNAQHDGPLRIAVLGCGTVGSSVVRELRERGSELSMRVGRELEVIGIAVRDLTKDRSQIAPAELFTDDPQSLVTRADLVIELIGGIEPAKSLLLSAIEHGASVITANKQLLGAHGPELNAAAQHAGVDVHYEAAVAAAIPLVRPMRESLAGDEVRRVMGIVNGTTNFILDKMDRSGADFNGTLAEAQELGYAEADPTADIEGHDAQAKAAILASLAFHTPVSTDQVSCQGITSVTAEDIAAVRKMGCVVKLLAICERLEDGVSVRVHPAVLARSHPLASVREAYNAVFVEADLAGELMFYGPGAGADPTASAVLGDLVQAARQRVTGGRGPVGSAHAALPVMPIEKVRTRYVLRLSVRDEPGVLASVATIFGDHQISIESMRQGVARVTEGVAPLTIATHEAGEEEVEKAVAELSASGAVEAVSSVLRMEGF